MHGHSGMRGSTRAIALIAAASLFACGDPLGAFRFLAAELQLTYNGPFASDLSAPSPTVAVAAGGFTISASSVFGESGHQLEAVAYAVDVGGGPLVRVEVRSAMPGGGVALIWLMRYEVRVRVPPGTYRAQLVRKDPGTPPVIEWDAPVVVP
jgi:hypothetical protein